jgi:hypothetical protein
MGQKTASSFIGSFAKAKLEQSAGLAAGFSGRFRYEDHHSAEMTPLDRRAAGM